jgi:hypothetical protein
LFLLIVTIVAIAFVATTTPVKVAKKQFEDIRQNNLQVAYDLFSSDAKVQVSFEEFQKFVSSFHLSDASTASISFNSRERKLQAGVDEAILGGKITLDGSVSNLEYILVKENDSWKILSFEIPPR